MLLYQRNGFVLPKEMLTVAMPGIINSQIIMLLLEKFKLKALM